MIVSLGACSAPDVLTEQRDGLRGRSPVARPCRADSFYVDFPVERQALASTGFIPALRTELQGLANQPGLPWFCGHDQITCPNGSVTVTLASVLPQRTGPFRGDGHLRFFRIKFFAGSIGQLSVRPWAHCSVVETIRGRFSFHATVPPDAFFTGRECDASGMNVQAAPSQEMLTWHVVRMGLPESVVNVTAPSPAAQTVDLALLDSGVVSRVGTEPGGIGVASESDFLPPQASLHPHGTAMAILTRQVAPDAALHSMRVLEAGGSGAAEALAKGLDEALFGSLDPSKPLVVNLSLGWPAELGRAANLTNPAAGCSSWEDPFGEPVRYLLDAARRLDDSADRAIFVSAAAGNQPLPVPASLYPPPPSSYPQLCGSSQSNPGQPWTFPAQWNRVDSCRHGAAGVTRAAFGVSVIDDRDLIQAKAIPDSESPLVTPGQHVYASHPNAATHAAPRCGGGSPFPAPVKLPSAFSGTSVGAALVSAAAARAQAARIASNEPPFDWDTISRLLYLTGRSLCRNTPALVRVRRLDVARLDHALSEPSCEPLLACAAATSGVDAIPATLLNTCKQALSGCGLELLDQNGDIREECPGPFQAVGWPEKYTSPTCDQKAGPTTFQDAALCSPTCPFEDEAYRPLLGTLGPEPGKDGCPDCGTFFNVAAGEFKLIGELNAELPPDTTFSNPYLVLIGLDQNQATQKSFVDLSAISDPSFWTPGNYLALSGGLAGVPNFEWSTVTAYLSVTITQPDAEPVKDISAMRVQFE